MSTPSPQPQPDPIPTESASRSSASAPAVSGRSVSPALKTKRKQRLDKLLVELGHCDSRATAQKLIRAGEIQVDHGIVDKPGTEVSVTAEILVKARSPYVSRGGEKLAKALTKFDIPIAGRICLDGGISTGGFTDCLLQRGAQRVYGVDVGYGQVAWSLQTDGRVVIKERTNLRYLQPEALYEPGEALPDLAVVDVSFISVVKVLEALWRLTSEPREMVLLVKPQFEVGREKIGKKGVVRDVQAQAGAIWQVIVAARQQGWGVKGLTFSPITGPAGNIEFLLWLGQAGEFVEMDQAGVGDVAKRARTSLAG